MFFLRELARQLAIVSLGMIQNVQPVELLSWGKKKSSCSNLSRVVDHFNALTQWAKTYIVTGCSIKQRAHYIMKMISITYHSISLSNYHVATAILTALQQIAISRLKKTWNLVQQKSLTRFEDMKSLMDPENNWRNYRERLNQGVSPCIPYIGLLVQDVLFLDDGNQTFLSPLDPLVGSGQRILNWEKCQLIGAVIKKTIRATDASYPFVFLPHVVNELTTGINNRIQDDKEIYRMSVALVSNPSHIIFVNPFFFRNPKQ